MSWPTADPAFVTDADMAALGGRWSLHGRADKMVPSAWPSGRDDRELRVWLVGEADQRLEHDGIAGELDAIERPGG